MLRFSKNQTKIVKGFRESHMNNHDQLLATHGKNLAIGNASPLPRDVWGEWDKESVEIQRSVLAVFNDLSMSVKKDMNLGKLVHYFRTVSDSGEANTSLDGRSNARLDQPVVDYHGTPLPITDSGYGFGWREMLAAQTDNDTLNDDARINSVRRVAEKLETIALEGDSNIVVGGDSLYGLTNHPKRSIRTTAQALNGATGVQWQNEVKATLKLLHAKNYRVPATLYVNWDDWFYASTTKYSAAYHAENIDMNVMKMSGVASIVPSNSVKAGTIIALVKRSDVIQVLNGMPITTRAKFRANPEDDYNFMVMAACAVEIKYDADSNCGVAHSSLA